MTKPKVADTSDPTQRASRALSKLLFGGATYRLEIGAAIAATPIVNTAELSRALSVVRQSVNQELRILERAGLLIRAPGSGREVYLWRQESRYWAWCEEAHANAARMLERMPRF